MKKIVKLSIATVSLAIMASQAHAANTGAYVGLGAGASTLNTPSENIIIGEDAKLYKQSHHRTNYAGRVFAGYNFNQYVGVEAGATKYGTASYINKTIATPAVKGTQHYSMAAADLVAKAYLPIGESGFNVYALGGAALVQSVNTGKVYNDNKEVEKATVSTTHTLLAPKVGVGANYAIPNTNVSTGLEWNRVFGKTVDVNMNNTVPSADMYALTVSYNFG